MGRRLPLILFALAAAVASCSLISGLDDFELAGSSGAGAAAGGGAAPFCGDGDVQQGEACDDGNTDAGDGCSPTCTVESVSGCPGAQVALSPPGVSIPGDLSGLADTLDPSCGPGGADAVFAVTPTASGTLTATLSGSFDKSISIRSSCPSPYGIEVTELGCATSQDDATRRLWAHAGVTYYVIVDGQGAEFTLDLTLDPCGDGVVQGLEQCDSPADPGCVGCVACDGFGEILDPDTQHCYLLEQGTMLSWTDSREACIAWGGDLAGLSSKTEADFFINHPSLVTTTWIGAYAVAPVCSYVFVNGEPWRSAWALDEPNTSSAPCVDLFSFKGNLMNDDGCDIPFGYLCERAPAGGCGDGILQPGERCDDGNTTPGDGCDAACAPEGPCQLSEVTDPATGHCYRMESTLRTWQEAKEACEATGGYLAAIDSASENDLVASLLSGETWIGGYEGGFNDGTVIWEAPSLACFKAWAAGLPSDALHDCVVADAAGQWYDRNCATTYGYVCEREP